MTDCSAISLHALTPSTANAGTTSQALLLFSLGYFVGVFGFPLLAGRIIVEYGLQALLLSVTAVALLNWLITLARLKRPQGSRPMGKNTPPLHTPSQF